MHYLKIRGQQVQSLGTLLKKAAMIVCICNPSTLKRWVRVRQENHLELKGQFSGVQHLTVESREPLLTKGGEK